MCEINNIKIKLCFIIKIYLVKPTEGIFFYYGMCFIDMMLRFTITIRGGAIKIAELIVDQSLLSYHADLT